MRVKLSQRAFASKNRKFIAKLRTWFVELGKIPQKSLKSENIVKKQLEQNGYISRNWALRNYISRLSAIILNLKKQGYSFKAKNQNGDWLYYLKATPEIQQKSPDLKEYYKKEEFRKEQSKQLNIL